jgi:hypothetical protein
MKGKQGGGSGRVAVAAAPFQRQQSAENNTFGCVVAVVVVVRAALLISAACRSCAIGKQSAVEQRKTISIKHFTQPPAARSLLFAAHKNPFKVTIMSKIRDSEFNNKFIPKM